MKNNETATSSTDMSAVVGPPWSACPPEYAQEPTTFVRDRVSSGLGHGYAYEIDQTDFEAAAQAASRTLGAMIGARMFSAESLEPFVPAQAVHESFNR